MSYIPRRIKPSIKSFFFFFDILHSFFLPHSSLDPYLLPPMGCFFLTTTGSGSPKTQFYSFSRSFSCCFCLVFDVRPLKFDYVLSLLSHPPFFINLLAIYGLAHLNRKTPLLPAPPVSCPSTPVSGTWPPIRQTDRAITRQRNFHTVMKMFLHLEKLIRQIDSCIEVKSYPLALFCALQSPPLRFQAI